MITRVDLAPRVGADADLDGLALDDAIAVAIDAVNDFIGLGVDGTAVNTNRPMPASQLRESYLRAAVTQYKFAASVNGGYVTSPDGTMVPGQPNDILQKAMPILRKYVRRV